MSHFYGTLKGKGGRATRAGTNTYTSETAGWKGAIVVELVRDERDPDLDWFEVRLDPWMGSRGQGVLLARGLLNCERVGAGAIVEFDPALVDRYLTAKATMAMLDKEGTCLTP